MRITQDELFNIIAARDRSVVRVRGLGATQPTDYYVLREYTNPQTNDIDALKKAILVSPKTGVGYSIDQLERLDILNSIEMIGVVGSLKITNRQFYSGTKMHGEAYESYLNSPAIKFIKSGETYYGSLFQFLWYPITAYQLNEYRIDVEAIITPIWRAPQ